MKNKNDYSYKVALSDLSVSRVCYSRTHICDASMGVDSTRLLFVVKGSAEAHIASADYSVSEGSLVYIPEGTKYNMLWHGAPDIEYIVIKAFSTGAKDGGERYGFQVVENHSSEDTHRVFLHILALMKRETPADSAEAVSLYFSFLAQIIPSLLPERRGTYHHAVASAIQYIDTHYGEECDVETLARESYISPSRLYHLFNEELGTTPIKYRNSVRIMHALHDLKTTTLTLEEIAQRTGFNSVTYFRETFKKYSDMTPTEYRKSLVKE